MGNLKNKLSDESLQILYLKIAITEKKTSTTKKLMRQRKVYCIWIIIDTKESLLYMDYNRHKGKSIVYGL